MAKCTKNADQLLTTTIMSLTDVTTLFAPFDIETDSNNSPHNLET